MGGWTEPTTVEIVQLGRDLVIAWVEPSGVEYIVKTARMQGMAHVPTVHGLAAHTHTLGRAALDLYERGQMVAAMPIVRACYEAGLRAQWIAQSKDAIAAFANEDLRNRKNTARLMREGASDLFRGSADKLAHLYIDALDSSVDAQARNFESMCSDLTPGGPDMYLVYRAMSMEAHPSIMVVDQYLDERPDSESGVALLSVAKRSGGEVWLLMVVASMVWSARALDFFIEGRPRRNELRRAAQQLGVAEFFELTPDAKRRESRAAKDRRHAQRVGRRPRTRSE